MRSMLILKGHCNIRLFFILLNLVCFPLVLDPIVPDCHSACGDYHYIQPVYFVPTDAPHTDRKDLVMEGYRNLQEQWASWGWVFNLEEIVTVRGAYPCDHYDGWSIMRREGEQALMDMGSWNNEHAIYSYFGECTPGLGGAAAGALDNWQEYFSGTVNEISNGNPGVIGHELGHNFGLPHENCMGEQPDNHEIPSRGPMCNGRNNYPFLYPHEYQHNLVLNSSHAIWLEGVYETGALAEPTVLPPTALVFKSLVTPIQVKGSGLYLEVENGSASDGAYIGQQSASGSDIQLWLIDHVSDKQHRGKIMGDPLSMLCLPDDLFIQKPEDETQRFLDVFKGIFEHTDNIGHYNLMMRNSIEVAA